MHIYPDCHCITWRDNRTLQNESAKSDPAVYLRNADLVFSSTSSYLIGDGNDVFNDESQFKLCIIRKQRILQRNLEACCSSSRYSMGDLLDISGFTRR